MANVYELIDEVTLGSQANGVTFSSIPQTYADIIVSIVGKGSGNIYPDVRFNNVSASTYGYVVTYSAVSNVGSQSSYNSGAIPLTWTGNFNSTQTNVVNFRINDYTNANTGKGVLSYNLRPRDGYVEWIAGGFYTSQAINEINIQNGPFQAGTRFLLWGVSK